MQNYLALPHTDCFKSKSWQDADDSVLLVEDCPHLLIRQGLTFSFLKAEKKSLGEVMLSGVLSLKAQRSKEHAFRYFQLKAENRCFYFHTCVH